MEHIKTFLPKLQKLSEQYVHAPWETPTAILKQAHVIIGINYPYPIVIYSEQNKKAKKLLTNLKNSKMTNY